MSLSCCKRAKSRQKPPEVGLPGKALALMVENHWMMKSSGLMEPQIFWRVDEGKGWQFIRAFIGVKYPQLPIDKAIYRGYLEDRIPLNLVSS